MNIQHVLIEADNKQNFFLLMGDFLDAFYCADSLERERMAQCETIPSADRIYIAYAASAIHKLCNDYGLSTPEWVFDNQCYLYDKPYFGCNAKDSLRLLFMYKSPIEFKHRNLFVDENILSRV